MPVRGPKQPRHFPEGGPPRDRNQIDGTSYDSCEPLTDHYEGRESRRGVSPIAETITPGRDRSSR
jgi:hypothetical protein